MHSVCQEKLVSVANNGEGGDFRLCPFWPLGRFDWTKLAHCTPRSCILQNKTTIGSSRHILSFFLDKVPLWDSRGSGLNQNYTCTTRPWGQQNVTIDRYLQYLVTEEIEEQNIGYIQVARRTDGWTDGKQTDVRTNARTNGQTDNGRPFMAQARLAFDQ